MINKLLEEIRFQWWWRVSRRLTRDELARAFAWLLPRKVAYHAFVRVYAGTTDGGPHDEYCRVSKAWEAGQGR